MIVRNFNKALVFYVLAMIILMSAFHKLVWLALVYILNDGASFWLKNYFFIIFYFIPAIAMVITSKAIVEHRLNRDVDMKNKLIVANLIVMLFYIKMGGFYIFDSYMALAAIPVFFYSHQAFKDAML